MSLATSFVLCLCPLGDAFGLRWFAEQCQQKENAIVALRRVGADISYDYQWGPNNEWRPNASPPGDSNLKQALGEHFASEVVEIQLFKGKGKTPGTFGDVQLRLLASGCTNLKWLVLNDTNVTDQGLDSLQSLKHLERLDLEGCAVTPNGIASLRASLPHLKVFH